MKQIKFLAWSNLEHKFILDYKRILPACYVYKEPKYLTVYVPELSIPVEERDCELFLYTETKDKNGRDIFEGNILKEVDESGQGEWYYEVTSLGNKFICLHYMWDYKSWTYDDKGEEVFAITYEEIPLEKLYFNCEVVGHIKTNPELVKP